MAEAKTKRYHRSKTTPEQLQQMKDLAGQYNGSLTQIDINTIGALVKVSQSTVRKHLKLGVYADPDYEKKLLQAKIEQDHAKALHQWMLDGIELLKVKVGMPDPLSQYTDTELLAELRNSSRR